jgi:Rrf2 family protein
MKLSEAAALAVHAVTYLAAHMEETVSVKRMAGAFKRSEAHLSKVLQQLSRHGLVRGTRGPHGGFRLAALAEETSLLQVVEAMEGPLRVHTCLFDPPVCDGTACVFGDVLEESDRRFIEFLAATSVAQSARTGTFWE